MASDITPDAAPSPSSKAAEVITPEPGASARTTAGSGESNGAAEATADAGEDDVQLEPARKRKRTNTSGRSPLDGFKGNPYD
jgi:hypothetical protein